MVELKDDQQLETENQLPFHPCLMLMAQALIPCWNWIFESSQAEGSYVGDLTYLYSVLYPKEGEGICSSFNWSILDRRRRNDSRAVTQPPIVNDSVQFSSVAQSCLTLCDPMNRSTPGLPVHPSKSRLSYLKTSLSVDYDQHSPIPVLLEMDVSLCLQILSSCICS